MENKVFLLVCDVVVDYETIDNEVRGFKTLELAQDAFNKKVDEHRHDDEEEDYIIVCDSPTEYDAYEEEGYYSDSHTNIRIIEIEIEG